MSFAQRTDAQQTAPQSSYSANPYSSLLSSTNGSYSPTNATLPYEVSPTPGVRRHASTAGGMLPTSASWIVPANENYSSYVDADVYCEDGPYPYHSTPLIEQPAYDAWCWQLLPQGLIYRSYQAGVHESRLGIVLLESDNNPYWDAALGGRVGLLRFGSADAIRPQGWQLDFEGASLPRLTLDDARELESVDFRAGVPLTYGVGDWQFKFAYYHLSSHMGDEFALRTGLLASRINYVRDSLVLGASYYPIPLVRLYAESAYAMNYQGGAQPWEFQFGTEISQPGPTGFRGTPFVALNAHLREELDFGGDFTAQAGWLWRDPAGRTLRLGGHYFNGKSSQFQFFDTSEEQIGAGMWYDF